MRHARALSVVSQQVRLQMHCGDSARDLGATWATALDPKNTCPPSAETSPARKLSQRPRLRAVPTGVIWDLPLTVTPIAPLRLSRITVSRERILIATTAITGTRCLTLGERIEAAIRCAALDAILGAPRAIRARANTRQEQTGECDCCDPNCAHGCLLV